MRLENNNFLLNFLFFEIASITFFIEIVITLFSPVNSIIIFPLRVVVGFAGMRVCKNEKEKIMQSKEQNGFKN